MKTVAEIEALLDDLITEATMRGSSREHMRTEYLAPAPCTDNCLALQRQLVNEYKQLLDERKAFAEELQSFICSELCGKQHNSRCIELQKELGSWK